MNTALQAAKALRLAIVGRAIQFITATRSKMSKTLTLAEVATHDREEDCYLIIGNERTGGAKVYDVTKFLPDHPGEGRLLRPLRG